MLNKVNAFVEAVKSGDILDAITAGVIAREAGIDGFEPIDFLDAVGVLSKNGRCSWIGKPIKVTDPRVQTWITRFQSAIDVGVVSNYNKAIFQEKKERMKISGVFNGKYLIE